MLVSLFNSMDICCRAFLSVLICACSVAMEEAILYSSTIFLPSFLCHNYSIEVIFLASRVVNDVVVSLVMIAGETSSGKAKYKTMSIGKLSLSDYFPDLPSLDDNTEQLALVREVADSLSGLVSLSSFDVREVLTSSVSLGS